MKENDKDMMKLKKENVELKQNLQKILEKEENDKRYRMELEKVLLIEFFVILQNFIKLYKIGQKRNQFS